MNSKEFKEKLTSVTPDVPEHFHLRTERTLENIVSQEAHMKESTKKAIRTAGRYSTRTMILAAALAIMVCAVALAATQWHVFDSLSFILGTTPPPATDSLMQSNLYQETVNNVEITVREAGYDGKTLLLQYSYRMLDVDTPYGDQGDQDHKNQDDLDNTDSVFLRQKISPGAHMSPSFFFLNHYVSLMCVYYITFCSFVKS